MSTTTPPSSLERLREIDPVQSCGERILIVEDDPITARYLELGLKRMGYPQPSIAASSEAAIDYAATTPVDLILMDIQIEGARDGIDTARLLRERFDVPVIFLTGLADDSTMERARTASPLGYLVKPVKAEDLRTSLASALQKERLARAMRERECWFAATLDVMAEAVLGCDVTGQVIFANPAAYTLLGCDPAQPLHGACSDVAPLYVPQSTSIIDPMMLIDTTRAAVLKLPHDSIDVRVTARRATDSADRLLGVVLIIRRAVEDVSLAAEIRRLKAELASQSLIDDLTGLYNRRGLSVLGGQQLKLVRRNRSSCIVILIRLEGVKELNEEYGREAGDLALRDIANVMRQTFREPDIIARLGVEFAVLLNVANPQAVVERFERVMLAHADGTAHPWRIGFAWGVAKHNLKDPDSIPNLLAAAELALRPSANAGRARQLDEE